MAREGLVIDNFSGGLNNVVDPSLIEENEVAVLKNLVISRTGKLISRYPIYKTSDFPVATDAIKMKGYYRASTEVVYAVLSFEDATSPATYLWDIQSDEWTQVWDKSANDITTYADRLYLINEDYGGGYVYWDEAATPDPEFVFEDLSAGSTGTEMPAGNQIHFTKGRIYVSSRASGNTSSIRYSDITSSAAGTSIDDFPPLNVIDINEGDGQFIVKVIEGNNELFIFRTNSTYRLAFSASADPALGTLSSMSQNIGADCSRSVVEGENYLAVLHAGTLYQFAGYNFYPFNPANKVQFQVEDGFSGQKQGITKIGQYLLVWHHGYMYCYDTETGLWSEWQSDTGAAHFFEAPRGTLLDSAAVPTAYGVPYSDYATQGLLKLALEYPESNAETIRCEVVTRTYDIGQPSLFKRLFGWELLAVAANWIEGGLTAIDAYRDLESQLTWEEIAAYTWQEVEDDGLQWLPDGSFIPTIVPKLPSSNPKPQVIKISGKQTFKRGFFTVRFQTDGTSSTSPSRLDGIVLYLTNGRRMASARTA